MANRIRIGLRPDPTPTLRIGSHERTNVTNGRNWWSRISPDSRPNVRLRTGDSHMSSPQTQSHAASRGATSKETDR